MKITKLKPVPKKEVKEILEDALTKDFDSIIIFGFNNGEVFNISSSNISRLENMGALEAAKQLLWEAP